MDLTKKKRLMKQRYKCSVAASFIEFATLEEVVHVNFSRNFFENEQETE